MQAQQALRRSGGSRRTADAEEDEVETTISNLLEMLSSERDQRAALEAEVEAARDAADAARRQRSADAAAAAASLAEARQDAAAARQRDDADAAALKKRLAEHVRALTKEAPYAYD